MKEKKYNSDKTLLINIILELLEFSIGLFILNKINYITDQNINIFKSLDLLITTLVYLVVSVKSFSMFLEPIGESQIGKYFYKFYTMIISLGIVFVTLDIISFKSGKIVDFNNIYAFILGAVIVKGGEKTFQGHKLNFAKDLEKVSLEMQESSEILIKSYKELKESYGELKESIKELESRTETSQ